MIDRALQNDQFSGVVLVARHHQTIFLGVYGCADRENNLANTADTTFRIGSMNKMFTAIAILQLVEAGKVHLDDAVSQYLDDYPNREFAARVTIRELLTHTAGAGDIFGSQFDAHRRDLRELRDYAKLYGDRAPEFEPGSRYSYSNYGFVVLGLVIERVSRESYYDYVQSHVFTPARMISTGSLPEDVLVPRRSIGYMLMAGSVAWQRNTDTLPFRGTSAGGGYSTAEDLLRFDRAFWTARLLPETSVNLMTSGKVDTAWPGVKYGYGFMESTQDGVRWLGHEGGAQGMNGEYWHAPVTGYTLIALSNLDPPSATVMVQAIARLLPP
ncbi:MAG TPA: serine hydrolase domain-containing protein [Steroidobacteraceae bacterium]|nr:serine hydrolase domain-containing protein [Steroidobacteraceae bacterium]